MPQRFLRPGITTSRRWNSLDWDSQSFYIRLLTLVDDYGRFDADPQLLKSYAFPPALSRSGGLAEVCPGTKNLRWNALSDKTSGPANRSA